jgi:hypothetical protein
VFIRIYEEDDEKGAREGMVGLQQDDNEDDERGEREEEKKKC